MTATLILYALMLGIVIYSVRKERGPLLEKIGFTKVRVSKETLIAIGFFALILGVAFAISIAFSILNPEDASKVSETIKQVSVAEILVTIVAASFVEEIFFRGFLQRRTNLIFATFVFAFFHIVFGSLTEVIGAFVLGLILGMEYKYRKSLYAPVLSHFLYDLVIVLLVFGAPVGV